MPSIEALDVINFNSLGAGLFLWVGVKIGIYFLLGFLGIGSKKGNKKTFINSNFITFAVTAAAF